MNIRKILSVLLIVGLIAGFGLILSPKTISANGPPPEVWVDDDYNSSTPEWGVTHFAKIQDGINAVAAGGIVHVAGGTYNENVTINKTISLIGSGSTSGSTTTTTLQGTGSGNGILINASNIFIDGFEIKNYSIGIRSYGRPSNFGNLTIKNCNIHHNTQNGILLLYDTFNTIDIENILIQDNSQNGMGLTNNINITNLIIKDSRLTSNGQHGLYFAQSNISNIDIQDSYFEGSTTNGFSGITFGTTKSIIGTFKMTGGSLSYNKGCGLSIVQKPHIFTSIELDGVLINNNNESGIMLGGGLSTNDLTIKNCTFLNNAWEHLDLSGGWFGSFSATLININNNFFKTGPWCAIYAGSSGNFTTVKINYNYFIGSNFGIFNLTSKVFDARYNWWGDESGPSGVGPGTGDEVTANVDYSPWLVPNISVTKSDSPDPVAQGMPLTYTINWSMGSTWATWDGTTISNTAVNIPSGLTFGNVSLKDTLPSEVTYVSCTGGGTHSSGVITWNLGTYTPGKTGSITLKVNVNLNTPDGTITNNVEIIYDLLKRLDTETTLVQKGAQSVYSFYDSRSNTYFMIDLSAPRWRVVIPSKGYDTGWMSFNRYTKTNNHFWGEYADTRYHLIIDFYSSGRYHIIFDDRVTGISIKIAN